VHCAGVPYFAVICAWPGERDLAIEQLETPAKIPNGASYGDLRSYITPLRGGHFGVTLLMR
jgi:hypothetical protein